MIIYHLENHLYENKAVFKKKFFCENHLWGTLATFFEKIFLLGNILCRTSVDAVSRADCKHRLGFSLGCYFKETNRDLGQKTRVFGNPLLSTRWLILFSAITNGRFHMEEYSLKVLSSIWLELFLAFEKYDMTHFLRFSFIKVKKKNSKKRFLLHMVRCSSTSWFRISSWFFTKMMPCFQK